VHLHIFQLCLKSTHADKQLPNYPKELPEGVLLPPKLNDIFSVGKAPLPKKNVLKENREPKLLAATVFQLPQNCRGFCTNLPAIATLQYSEDVFPESVSTVFLQLTTLLSSVVSAKTKADKKDLPSPVPGHDRWPNHLADNHPVETKLKSANNVLWREVDLSPIPELTR